MVQHCTPGTGKSYLPGYLIWAFLSEDGSVVLVDNELLNISQLLFTLTGHTKSYETAISTELRCDADRNLSLLRLLFIIIIIIIYSSVWHLQPFMSLSRLILEVPRSHTRTHHSR
jgi:hypothetical protein